MIKDENLSYMFQVNEHILIFAHSLYSTVFMLKPNVGEIVLMSSPMNLFSMVVFPALSSPLYSINAVQSFITYLRILELARVV